MDHLQQYFLHLVKFKKNLGGDDDFEIVVNFVKEIEYFHGIGENVSFSFGCKYGNRDDNDHLIYNFTSISLLKNIQNNYYQSIIRIYHIDGTHKVVKRYVLIVFGTSDINGHLHLISLSIFSHETEEDFKHFYAKLFELCSMLNILFFFI